MTSFIPLNLCGEATHPRTRFTPIHVDSCAALDLYNTQLLGNSGLLHLHWCPSSPTQAVRSWVHPSQLQHSLISVKNVQDVTQNPSVPDRSKEVTEEDRVQLSWQPLQASELDCCSIWQRILLHVRSHCVYQEPRFPGPAALGGTAPQHSSFQESDNELLWGSNGEPGFLVMNDAV